MFLSHLLEPGVTSHASDYPVRPREEASRGGEQLRTSQRTGSRTNPGGLCPIQGNPVEHGRPSRGSDCLWSETYILKLDSTDPRALQRAFLDVPEGGVEGASGRVSFLVGQDNLRLFPVEKRRSGGMAQIKSQFGTGWVVCGNAEKLLLN